MRTISSNWRSVFYLVLGIVIAPLIVYWVKFGSLGFSSDFDEWVNFSTYWSPYLVAALTIILAYISWQSLELMKLKEKPLLVVEKRAKKKGGEEFLSIRNIGSGPALEIKLFIGIEKNEGLDFNKFLVKHGITAHLDHIHKYCEFHYMVTEFALSHSELVYVDWQEGIEKIAVVYTDIYGQLKTVIWNESETLFMNNDHFGIDKNGKKDKTAIYLKNKAANRNYNQVFSLPEVGRIEPVGWVLT